jgi:hypothetical protein
MLLYYAPVSRTDWDSQAVGQGEFNFASAHSLTSINGLQIDDI